MKLGFELLFFLEKYIRFIDHFIVIIIYIHYFHHLLKFSLNYFFIFNVLLLK